MEPAILLRNEAFVAVDKKAGETVIPARGEAPGLSLVRRLENALGQRLWVVHRIDRETSGIVLFALNADSHRELNRAFEERRVEKEYVAFVAGTLEPAQGCIDLPLHAARRGKSRPAAPGEPGSREAVTEYAAERVFRRGEEAVSRLRLRPRSGRHHQIRVHLRARGAPILFDALYGRGAVQAFAAAPCGRLALHAARLRVSLAGGVQDVEAPLAADLGALDDWLGDWERA